MSELKQQTEKDEKNLRRHRRPPVHGENPAGKWPENRAEKKETNGAGRYSSNIFPKLTPKIKLMQTLG